MRRATTSFIWATLMVSNVAWATVLRVPQEYATIQAAVNRAGADDTVVIAPGTYTGQGNVGVEVHKAVTIRGVAPGDPCTVAATVVDCRGRGRAFSFRGQASSQAILAGLTITGGRARDGSGIYIARSSPTITRCRIVGNGRTPAGPAPMGANPAGSESPGPQNGGGIFLRDSYAIIRYCLIVDNEAGDHGGGICCYNAAPTITNCSILRNHVRNEGGGISLLQGSGAALRRCRIAGNIAAFRRGGGVACRSSHCSLTNCIVAGNRAGPGDGGGGLWLYRSAVVIDNDTIAGNVSESTGGGIYCDLCDVLIENSIIWGNTVLPPGQPTEVTAGAGGRGDEIAVHSWPGRYEGKVPWPDLTPEYSSFLDIAYTDLRGGRRNILVVGDARWFQLAWRRGNVVTDPLLADPAGGDYHLRSQAGRWDPTRRTWIQDEVTSPAIDAGDPLQPVAAEPAPDGGVINLGAYGGTAEASKSYTQGPGSEAVGAGP